MDGKKLDVNMIEDANSVDINNDRIAKYRALSADEARAIEKRVVRKVDMRILPCILLIYILNYLDRNSITQARLYGLQKDAHVDGALWQTAISILSVGYIAMQIPSTIVMPYVRPSIYLPCCMIAWAITSGCTAFVTSTAGLLVVRFFLGITEAPFFPCAIYLLSCWYKKKELGIRVALFVCGIPISNAFAGLIAAGILSGMNNAGGLHAWQWLFIIEGLVTIVVALASIFILADYPATTRWLSEDEKTVAVARLALDIGSEEALEEQKVTLLQSIALAAKDYRTWLFAGMQMATTASISYSHFFPTLIKELGFKNNTTTLLLTSPPYVAAFLWAMTSAWLADRKQMRSPFAGTSAVVAIIGSIASATLKHNARWERYGMLFMVTCGTYGIYTTTYAWLSSTLARPPAKRAAAIGIANTFANLASFYGNYFWLDKFEPDFIVSWWIVVAFLALSLGCILTLRFVLSRANTRFARLADEYADRAYMDDLTEEEVRAVRQGFRFII